MPVLSWCSNAASRQVFPTPSARNRKRERFAMARAKLRSATDCSGEILAHWGKAYQDLSVEWVLESRVEAGLEKLAAHALQQEKHVRYTASPERLPYISWCQEDTYDDSVLRCCTCNVSLNYKPMCPPACPSNRNLARGCPLQQVSGNEQKRNPLPTCQGRRGQKRLTEESYVEYQAYQMRASAHIFAVPREQDPAAGAISDKANSELQMCPSCRAADWRDMSKTGKQKCDACLSSKMCMIDSMYCLNSTRGIAQSHSAQGRVRSHGYQPKILYSFVVSSEGEACGVAPTRGRMARELEFMAMLQGMPMESWPDVITPDHFCMMGEWWEYSDDSKISVGQPLRLSAYSGLGGPKVKRTNIQQRFGRQLYAAFSNIDNIPEALLETSPVWHERREKIQLACADYYSFHDCERWSFRPKKTVGAPRVRLQPSVAADDLLTRLNLESELDGIVHLAVVMRANNDVQDAVQSLLRVYESRRMLGGTWDNTAQRVFLEKLQSRSRKALRGMQRSAGSVVPGSRLEPANFLTELVVAILRSRENMSTDSTAAILMSILSQFVTFDTANLDECVRAWSAGAMARDSLELPNDVGDSETIALSVELDRAFVESGAPDPTKTDAELRSNGLPQTDMQTEAADNRTRRAGIHASMDEDWSFMDASGEVAFDEVDNFMETVGDV